MDHQHDHHHDHQVEGFSRPFQVDGLRGPKEIHISAKPDERLALAARFGLPSLNKLEATVTLKPTAGGKLIELSGRFQAELTQTCVVTLEPFASSIEEDFRMTFSTEEGKEWDDEFSIEDDDPPECLEGGVIDLGESVAQHFCLALDPYPRSSGAEFSPPTEAKVKESPGKANPFAVLAALKEKKGG